MLIKSLLTPVLPWFGLVSEVIMFVCLYMGEEVDLISLPLSAHDSLLLYCVCDCEGKEGGREGDRERGWEGERERGREGCSGDKILIINYLRDKMLRV